MKQGTDLHGYRIVTKPTNADAGKCMWAFAEKDGCEYFVKEFLDPKRPRAGSMGDAATKRALLAQCAEFERRHWSVIERLDPDDVDAGNLVTAENFFHEGTRYYKVTRRLHPADVAPHTLSAARKRVLIGTLLDSLALLHRLGIVHGDLKPQNILTHRPPGSDLCTAKLIDFDDAYVSGRPPGPDEVGGDPLYAAPEWVRYAAGDDATDAGRLTTAADLFALGLVIHVFLTGALPGYGSTHASPAEAVNAGVAPVPDPRLHRVITELLRRSLSREPTDRPTVAELRPTFDKERLLEFVEPPPAGRTGRPSSRIRNSFGPDGGREARLPGVGGPPSPPGARSSSRVRINLGGDRPGSAGSR